MTPRSTARKTSRLSVAGGNWWWAGSVIIVPLNA
jgi:hypothetical protein